jgi:tetratricopeptide (TPR) repeat protein
MSNKILVFSLFTVSAVFLSFGVVFAQEESGNSKINYLEEGVTQIKSGKVDEAIASFTQAITDKKQEAEAYNNRGYAHYIKGNTPLALEDIGQAIRINPGFSAAYVNRAAIYQKEGSIDLALQDADEAISLEPDSVEALCTRGTIYYLKNNFDNALADFNLSISLAPDYFRPYRERAIVYYAQGDYSKAWQDVIKVKELGGECNPNFIEELRNKSGVNVIYQKSSADILDKPLDNNSVEIILIPENNAAKNN